MDRDREYWRQHVLAHRRSRLTQEAYCSQNGLHPKTYRTWSRRLEAEGAVAPNSVFGEAMPMEGAEELSYPLPEAPSSDRPNRMEISTTIARRQLYSEEEKRQFVLSALQSGIPIERYARMAGLTPSALHRWKHKYAVHIGMLPAAPAQTAPLFAPVTVSASSDRVPSSGDPATPALKAMVWNSVDIMLGNGRRLVVDVRVDGVALRRLMAILEAPA